MRAVVVIFPGSNRERDVCAALALVIGREPVRVWHRDTDMPRSDLIVLPGGFAYGDYLRCGAMATPILGICNGFQILAEAGMLPGALLPNRSLRFTCRDIHLRVENNQTIFTCGYAARQTIRVPVAHHDGNYTADPDTLDRLEDRGLVAFRYCGPDGDLSETGNFNGSARAMAGIFNNSRTVLGLMPHLENAVDPLLGGTDGRAFFEGLVGALQ